MARPASRHGRYDANVRFSPLDVNHNPKSRPTLDYHSRGAVHLGYSGPSEHQPPSSRSRRGQSDQFLPLSPSPNQGGPLLYSQEECARPPSRRNTNASRQHSLPLDDMDGYPRPWSSGSDEGYVPSPPPRPPSASRPRPQSSRKRPVTSRKSQPQPMEEDLPDVTIMRPPSSFSKFCPLPSIRNQSPEGEGSHSITSQMNDLHLGPTRNTNTRSHDHDKTKTDVNPSLISPKYFTGPHPLPQEPSEQESRLQLAIKLPTNGKRYHRYFSPEDYLQDLHHFAENVSQEDLTDYVLACNAPRKVFSNLTQRICDVGLLDKTVLYFEERSDM